MIVFHTIWCSPIKQVSSLGLIVTFWTLRKIGFGCSMIPYKFLVANSVLPKNKSIKNLHCSKLQSVHVFKFATKAQIHRRKGFVIIKKNINTEVDFESY